MVKSETVQVVTCDDCGRTLEAGEIFFRVTSIVTTFTFDGSLANRTEEGANDTRDLCAADYGKLGRLSPTAVPVTEAPL